MPNDEERCPACLGWGKKSEAHDITPSMQVPENTTVCPDCGGTGVKPPPDE